MTGVHNHLEVVLPESNYRDDIKLATAANNALAANVTVPDSMEATAEDGNITDRDRVLRHGAVCRRSGRGRPGRGP